MVIFKDRKEAGKKLAEFISKKKLKKAVVISLLRGGVVVGQEISRKLKLFHLPLAIAKISAPHQQELAIGALCFDFTYLEPKIINSFNFDKLTIRRQIKIAKKKFDKYRKKFNIKKSNFRLRNKTVIIVDDGAATGSTIKAALLFIKSFNPKKIVLALPVAPANFSIAGLKNIFVLYFEREFSSVSQFYQDFSQITDEEIRKIFLLPAYK